MIKSNMTNDTVNGWAVLFNIPNLLGWSRMILLFVSLRCFGQRRYLSFIIYHIISGLLDSFDGIIARSLNQYSYLGQYMDSILDEYAHIVMYACVGCLYPSYIIYFFFEIALEVWNTTFNSFIHTLPRFDNPTFLSNTCALSIWLHPNLRWLNWYAPDVFHVLLIIRLVFIEDTERKFMIYIKRYISMKKFNLLFRYAIFFTGFFTILRTVLSSCFMIDKFYRMAELKQTK